MKSPREPGPERVGEILGRLFAVRGWARRQGRLHLERAWELAVGQADAPHTRVGGLRRGVLEVEVDNAALMQELAQFRKRRLLQSLRERLPGTSVNDVRFRAGAWNVEE